MSANTSIEWTDHTFNPWWGCQEVSPACDDCYARNLARFYASGMKLWGPGSVRRFFGDHHWNEPRRWDRKAKAAGVRYRVFCASMADVFDNHPDVGPHRERLFGLIRETPHLDWLLLTKRIGNAKTMLPSDFSRRNYPNVRIGATFANQGELDRDVEKLFAVSHRTFVSLEPLLGPIDLRQMFDRERRCPDCGWAGRGAHGTPCGRCGLRAEDGTWVIVGGESGSKARPMNPQWARDIRDQCVDAAVPFLFKQWGEWRPANCSDGDVFEENDKRWHVDVSGWSAVKVGKKEAGRVLDGRTWDQFPEVA